MSSGHPNHWLTALIMATAAIIVGWMEFCQPTHPPPEIPDQTPEQPVPPATKLVDTSGATILRGQDICAAVVTSVNQIRRDARAIVSTIKERGELGKVQCVSSETIGMNLVIKLNTSEKFYPKGRYAVEQNPLAKDLAWFVLRVYRQMNSLPNTKQGDQISVDIEILGTADGSLFDGNTRPIYRGDNFDCTCIPRSGRSEPFRLRDGQVINNRLLGCARAAAFAQYLSDHQVDVRALKLKGKEYKVTGDQFRSVYLEITFNNILNCVDQQEFAICDLFKGNL